MNITYGFMKELRENMLTIRVNGEDKIIPLMREDVSLIVDAIEQGTYLVPFDLESNEVVLGVEEKQYLSLFPEAILDELKDAADVPAEYR